MRGYDVKMSLADFARKRRAGGAVVLPTAKPTKPKPAPEGDAKPARRGNVVQGAALRGALHSRVRAQDQRFGGDQRVALATTADGQLQQVHATEPKKAVLDGDAKPARRNVIQGATLRDALQRRVRAQDRRS